MNIENLNFEPLTNEEIEKKIELLQNELCKRKEIKISDFRAKLENIMNEIIDAGYTLQIIDSTGGRIVIDKLLHDFKINIV